MRSRVFRVGITPHDPRSNAHEENDFWPEPLQQFLRDSHRRDVPSIRRTRHHDIERYGVRGPELTRPGNRNQRVERSSDRIELDLEDG
jgi:hypothetical protein